MRTAVAVFAALMLVAAPTAAGPTAGGFASDNVEYVDFVPFEAGTATGASLVGDYLYVTTWRSFSIYDVTDPVAPELVSVTPVGVKFENEDVATDGKILLFSEEVPGGTLHVWDVEDKANPVEIATIEGAGDHTHTCILDCRYSYGSGGSIVDLRDPAKAELVGNWHEKAGVPDGTHDVEEFRRGFIVTSPYYGGPIQLLDVRKPLAPKLVVSAEAHPVDEEPVPAASNVHSTRWPRRGNDRFLMAQGGSNLYQQSCSDEARNFWTFDATRWEKQGVLEFRDEFTPGHGAPTEGRYPASILGCSSHWFEVHPRFRDGGFVVAAYYDYGTRFLEVSRTGKISEAGWFLPYAGVTSSAYWATPRIAYAIDLSRGFDILKFSPK